MEALSEPGAGQAVAGWVEAWSRALRIARMYPAGHSSREGVVQRCHAELTRILEDRATLVLDVRYDRILWEERPVLFDPDRAEGLPIRLFRAGIARTRMSRGLDGPEMRHLVQALAAEDGSTDLVGRLWAAPLPHFDYDRIDLLDPDLERAGPEFDALVDDELLRLREGVRALTEVLGSGSERAAVDDEAFASPIEVWADLEDGLPGGRPVPPEAAERFQAVLAAAQGPEDHDRRLGAVLVDRLRATPRSASAWAAAVEIASRPPTDPDLERAFRILHGLIEGLDEPGRQILAERAHRGGLEAATAIFASSRSAPARQAAARVVAEVSTSPSQRPRVEAALRTLGETPPELVQLFAEPSGETGEDPHALPADVLAELAGSPERHPPERAGALVRAAAGHRDPTVRAAAMAGLLRYDGPEADAMVTAGLDDEALEVRLAALRAAAQPRAPEVDQRFAALLEDQDGRAPEEWDALFETARAVRGARVRHLFAERLGEGSVGQRCAAARALGRLGDAASLDILRKGARTLNRQVRKACQGASESRSRPPAVPLPPDLGPLPPVVVPPDPSLPTHDLEGEGAFSAEGAAGVDPRPVLGTADLVPLHPPDPAEDPPRLVSGDLTPLGGEVEVHEEAPLPRLASSDLTPLGGSDWPGSSDMFEWTRDVYRDTASLSADLLEGAAREEGAGSAGDEASGVAVGGEAEGSAPGSWDLDLSLPGADEEGEP